MAKLGEGWPILQAAINKMIEIVEEEHMKYSFIHNFTLKDSTKHNFMVEDHMKHDLTLEDHMKRSFNVQERIKIYTNIFNATTSPNLMYEIYNKVFQDYISSIVLPCLVEKKDEDLLQEVVTRWVNHKLMTRWMEKFFFRLDQCFFDIVMLPGLQESSYSIFHKLVLLDVDQVMESIMRMIDKVNRGEKINQSLLKTAIEMWVEMVKGYECIFKQTHQVYYFKAVNWINSMEF